MTMNRARNHHPSVERILNGDVKPIDVLRHCGVTFYTASRLLPESIRHELALLYAFCRVIDDCVDGSHEITGERTTLELLHEIESDLYRGASDRPLTNDFLTLARRRRIPLAYARQLVNGVRLDTGDVTIETERQLLRYAFHVASTVGLMMCRVMRVPEAGDPFAIDLGIAMQLTNIARDVREDAAHGRVYIPESWLDHGTLRSALRGNAHATLETTRCVERLLALSDRYYASAYKGMRYLPVAVRPGIRAASVNYRAIGQVIRRDPAKALGERARTSSLSRVSRSGVAFLAAVTDTFAPHGRRHDDSLHCDVEPLLQTAVVT